MEEEERKRRVSGTLGSERATVEETIFFSSSGRKGRLMGSEPVARMIFLAPICSPATWTMVGEISLAAPGKNVILFFWKRAAIPSLKDVTTFCLRFIISLRENEQELFSPY